MALLVDLEAATDALDHAGEQLRQGDVLELRVRDGLAEEEEVVFALERDGAAVGTDALHPALELLHHTDLVIAEIDDHAVPAVQLVLHLQGGVVLRAREGDDGRVRELLDGAADGHLLDHSQPVVTNLYVELHRKHVRSV